MNSDEKLARQKKIAKILTYTILVPSVLLLLMVVTIVLISKKESPEIATKYIPPSIEVDANTEENGEFTAMYAKVKNNTDSIFYNLKIAVNWIEEYEGNKQYTHRKVPNSGFAFIDTLKPKQEKKVFVGSAGNGLIYEINERIDR